MADENNVKQMVESKNQFREALEKNEFTLYYQPKLDLESGRIAGVEALIRWVHPEKGVISPLEFIPIAEETGLILPIGEWVIRKACERNKKWQEEGFSPMIMAVNLSACQLYQEDLVETIQLILKETGLEPQYLELEITESMMMDVDHALRILRDLKRIGIQISLDDFGTGYSSLYYLKEFPIDKIKIDQSFVRNCTIDSKDATIINAMIAMAHQLKMEVIAEGIETRDQLTFLQQNLCNKGQGYFFSEPLPAEELVHKFYEMEQIVSREAIPQNVFDQKRLEEALETSRQELRDIAKGKVIGTSCITKDITHQKQLETTIQENEERYRNIVELTSRGHIIHQGGTILSANPSSLKILKEKQLIGKSIFSYLHPDDKDIFMQNLLEIEAGKRTGRSEIKMRCRDGEIIDTVMGGVSTSFNTNPAVLIIFGDVSNRKKAEQALQESEKRYRKLVEHSPEPIVVYRDGIILYANPASINLLGAISIEELIGKSITNYFDPKSVYLIEKRIEEMTQTGISVPPTEEKVIRLDGRIIDIEVSGITINHDGETAFLMMYHDISNRKQVEEALRKSEEKYRLIAENMTDLVCVLDWDGFFIYASPSHATVLGFPVEAYKGKRARNWMHNEDLPSVRNQLEEMVKTKKGRVFEYRFQDIKGNWIWLEGKAIPVFNEEDHFNHFLLVSREITERKMYEEKLTYMAYHDTLTGLPNRRLFNERLEQSIKQVERNESKLAVMYMDMDHFKHINDSLGHDAGDELLKSFSTRVQNCIRKCDTLARQGGDEFTILISEIQEEQEAIEVAKQIVSFVQKPWHVGEQVFQLSISIGIAFYPIHGITRHQLMRHADKALYMAKEDGRNNFKIY